MPSSCLCQGKMALRPRAPAAATLPAPGALRLSPSLTPPAGGPLRCGWEAGERKEPGPFAGVV